MSSQGNPQRPSHKGTQSDKQILETLAKVTEELSEQVNEPKKDTLGHSEPAEGTMVFSLFSLKLNMIQPMIGPNCELN